MTLVGNALTSVCRCHLLVGILQGVEKKLASDDLGLGVTLSLALSLEVTLSLGVGEQSGLGGN